MLLLADCIKLAANILLPVAAISTAGAALNDKFATEANFEMAYGGLELFYGG